jgi:hypothetical protein
VSCASEVQNVARVNILPDRHGRETLASSGSYSPASGRAAKTRSGVHRWGAKAPQNFGDVVVAYGFAVRIVMLHVRIFFHQRGMLEIVFGTGEDEFMVEKPVVRNDKLYLLAEMHYERSGPITWPAMASRVLARRAWPV